MRAAPINSRLIVMPVQTPLSWIKSAFGFHQNPKRPRALSHPSFHSGAFSLLATEFHGVHYYVNIVLYGSYSRFVKMHSGRFVDVKSVCFYTANL